MFRFNVTSSMLSNKITSSQDGCVRVQRQDVGCGWDSVLMDSSLLVLCLLWSQPAPGSVCDGERRWQWPWGLSGLRSGFLARLNHWGKLWLLFWELMWDQCPVKDSTADGVRQLKESGLRSDLPVCIYSRQCSYCGRVAVAWCKTVSAACCLNDEGGFGRRLECCRALCWRSCVLLLLSVSSRPQALH